MKGKDGRLVELWFDIEAGDRDSEIPLVLQKRWRTTIWEVKNGEIDPYGKYYEADGEKFTGFKEAVQKARREAKRLRELGYTTYVSSASSKAKFRIKTVQQELLMSALPIYQNKDYRKTYTMPIF